MAEKQLTSWRSVVKRKGSDASLLYSEDLGPAGTEVAVEIIDTGVMSLDDGEGRKKPTVWLAFQGSDGKPKKKRLGLNATMCKTMTALTGSTFIEEWRGWITLIVVNAEYRDSTTGTKERTDVIRIAPKRPLRAASKSSSSSPPKDAAPPPESKGWNGDPPPVDEDEARLIAEREAKEAGRG